jgi:phage gpG-like protein
VIKHKLDDAAFSDRLRLIKKQSGNLAAPLEECAEIVVSSIEQNFESEGRFSAAGSWRGGTNRWSKSGAAKGRNGMTLSDTGQLRASITKRVANDNAEIGTNKEYAAVHNFGIDASVNVKEHQRKTKSGKSATVRAHTRHMRFPARPFMVVQDSDTEEMLDVLDKHIMQ